MSRGSNLSLIKKCIEDPMKQCTYQATVQHPAVCDHDRVLLYPLLSDNQGTDGLIIM